MKISWLKLQGHYQPCIQPPQKKDITERRKNCRLMCFMSIEENIVKILAN